MVEYFIGEFDEMKIIFLSNYLTHHQTELCNCLYRRSNNDFWFVQTEEMSDERKKLGWGFDTKQFKYVFDYSASTENELIKKIVESDVIIIGDTNIDITRYHIKKDALIFFYRERLFKVKKPLHFLRRIRLWGKYTWKYRQYKAFVLCASAYSSKDFDEIWSFKNKCYKWGYFPKCVTYEIDELIRKKQSNSKIKLLWTGRFIHWKRIFDVLELAKKLKELRIDYQLDILGGGILQEEVETFIKDNDLVNYVSIVGNVPFEKVREYMENANIYIMTSNQEEGWGVVVNEAMNSGCVVIGSDLAGSVPYLIENGKNGLIYNCGDLQDLLNKVIDLILDPIKMETLGKNAYFQIHTLWNADIATERFFKLVDILNRGEKVVFNDGPCSIAEIVMERK